MDLITTPFGETSNAAEVADGVDLSGWSVVVTGAASGIRVETARALARTGAAVTLAVRGVDAGRRCTTPALLTSTTFVERTGHLHPPR